MCIDDGIDSCYVCVFYRLDEVVYTLFDHNRAYLFYYFVHDSWTQYIKTTRTYAVICIFSIVEVHHLL